MNNFNKLLQIYSMSRISYCTMFSCKTISSQISSRKSFHSICKPLTCTENILKPETPFLSLTNGMKQKGKVQRRCADCYMVWRQGRLYNICKTKPRHNQMSLVKPERDTWILSFSSKKPRRDW